MATPDNARCPQCGASTPAGATLERLCSGCLLKLALTASPTSTKAGDRIGPYRIVEVLGEGGMGIVYLAEQEEPIRRRVALKVIKVGMDTRDVVARFDSERQALALMDHPHIARVLDAGADASGHPYFVMEYVPGLPITEFCDEHLLSTAARLALMQQVCAAVQHAHQRGIIHRDLKPSNVLVMVQDGQPTPKVIDFGVAKAIERDLLAETFFTEHGRLLGTPEYMSPEQASLGAATIGTQTDIYSLGVMLYELLVGVLPFEMAELRRAGHDEIRRVIREVEPVKPSTRISTLGMKAGDAATRRRTHPDGLLKQLRGDLDWITLRALEKDPARRYASASEFAADIFRHLNDEPVAAGPPGATYRIGKFVRRYRTAVAVASAFVLLLATAALVSTMLFLRAENARREAERRRVQADEARDATEQQRRMAEAARVEAGQQRAVAESQSQAAQDARSDAERQRDEAERRSYASNIAAADLSLTAGEIREAKRLLDLCAPRLRGWEWGYLRREADGSVATLQGRAADPRAHLQQFDAVSLARDRLFAVGTIGGSASSANAVAEFDLAGNPPTSAAPTLVPLDLNTSVLAISGDGRRLLVTRWYGTRPSARLVLDADGRRSSDGSVELRAENPDLPGDDRNRLFVIDSASRQIIAAFSLNPVGVWRGRARDASAIGLRTVSPASRIGQIVDGDLRQPIATVSYPVAVRGVLSEDGSRAAAWSWDNVVHVWDVSSGRAVATLAGHEAFISQAVFTSDSRQLVSGSHDGTVRIWDVESSRTSSVLRLPADLPNQINAIGVSAGRDLIAAGLRNGLIRVWRGTGLAVLALQGHRLPVTSLAFDRTGTRLVSASEDRTLRVWDTAGMFELLTWRGHEDAITGVAFNADKNLIASSSIDGTVRLWNASAMVESLVETNLRVPGMAFLDSGSMIVSGHSDDIIRVWDLTSGQVTRQTKVPAEVSSLTVSPDAQLIAVGLVNRATRTRPQPGVSAVVIDSKTMQTVATLAGQNETVQSVAWSGDGRRLATTSDSDNSVRLWDAASGRKINEWKGASSPMRSLAIARDSSHLARLAGSVSPTAAVAFSPGGNRLVSGGGDDLVRIWDVRSGTQLAALPGHDGGIQAVAISPDGRRIASGGTDRTVRIWSVDSHDLLLTLRVNNSVQSLAFSADGERLAAGLLGGTIRVWYSRSR